MAQPDPLREHRLRALLEEAARGRFPPSDGSVALVDPPAGRVDAVLGFTAHHVIAASVDPGALRARLAPPDGGDDGHGRDLGAPMSAPFLAWLGATLGAGPGTLDVVLAAPGVPPGGSLDEMVAVRPVPPTADHPRVRRAAAYRDQLRAWTTWDGGGVLVVGRGLAGRWEAAFEVEPAARGRGIGRGLAAAARRLIPEDAYVFAQVAPGNASSLRALLAAGYRPIGSEVLFLRRATR